MVPASLRNYSVPNAVGNGPKLPSGVIFFTTSYYMNWVICRWSIPGDGLEDELPPVRSSRNSSPITGETNYGRLILIIQTLSTIHPLFMRGHNKSLDASGGSASRN